MHREPSGSRPFCALVGAMLLAAGCGATRLSPADDNGVRPTLSATVLTQGNDTPLIEPASVVAAQATLEAAVSTPFCCDANERVFEARLAEADLAAGATCRWEFGDGASATVCRPRHRFVHAGIFTTTLSVVLSGGEELATSVDVTVGDLSSGPIPGGSPSGSAAPVAPPPDPINTPIDPTQSEETTDAASIRVAAGRDIEVAPGQRVQLSATVTVEPATATFDVLWEQRGGPNVVLSASHAVDISFTAPVAAAPITLSFSVTATSGPIAATDLLTVTVTPPSDTVRADDPRFGYDPADATDAVQRAIDSGAGTVVIPDVGRPWIVRPLRLRSDLRLVLEPGVVLEAKADAFHGTFDSLLSGDDLANVTIEGHGATLRMRKSDYTSQRYTRSEWRHGLALRGVVNVEVLGLRVEQTGGDGMSFGPTSDQRRLPCRNVVVRDCVLANNYRNGISIVSGENILIEDCLVTGTSGTAPQAGLLFEPSDRIDPLVNIRVRNCVADGNAGSGFMTNLSNLDDRSAAVDVVIDNCVVRDSVQPGLRAILREDLGATGSFEFLNCQVDGTQYAGAKIIWDVRSAVVLRFTGCRWTDVARKGGEPPLEFELTRPGASTPGGSVFITNGQVFNDRPRDLIRLIATDDGDYPEIVGDVSVTGTPPDELTFTRLPDLRVTFDRGGL